MKHTAKATFRMRYPSSLLNTWRLCAPHPSQQPQQPAPLKMYSRRVTLTLLCLTLVVALVTQEAQASKLKKVAKYALIGAALAPRIVPIPIPIG